MHDIHYKNAGLS